MYIPGTTYLHILLHCTLYLIAHLTPYFISLFVSYFILTIFIYILSRVLFHSFYCFYVIFILLLFLFFCTFHWADLSWLTFHYLLYPVWLCMWQIIKNLENLIYSSYTCSKPVWVYFFCWTQKKIFWRLLVTKQLTAAIDLPRIVFFSTLWKSMVTVN